MKTFTLNLSKLIIKISFILMLILISLNSQAQSEPDIPGAYISNCYQTVLVNQSNKNIKLLNFGGIPNFTLDAGYTSTAFKYFSIRQYSPYSGLFEYIEDIYGAGWPYVILYDDIYGVELRAYQSFWDPGQTPLHLFNNQPIIIDFYTRNEDPFNPGQFIYDATYRNIRVDFIGTDEAFNINPGYGNSCFTYNNFQIDNDIINLEGFCGSLGDYKLKLHPGATDTKGLIPNYSSNIIMTPLPPESNTPSNPINIPIEPDACLYCNTIVPAAPSPDPISCGCMDFDVEFVLFPCITNDPNCPIITVTKPIKICCTCDIRSVANPND